MKELAFAFYRADGASFHERLPLREMGAAKAALAMMQETTRSGFTLVELLAVIAVIGLLVAILVPAVVHSQESVRRLECQANLRELGLALLRNVNQQDAFPPGCIGCRFQAPAPGETASPLRFISWNVYILPSLADHALYYEFNFEQPSYHASNLTIGRTRIQTFLCPSTPQGIGINMSGLWRGRAFTDYGGVYGVEGVGRTNTAPNARQFLLDECLGVMLFEEKVQPKDVADGVSRTVCLAEMKQRRQTECEWANGQNVFAQEGSTPINGSSGLGNDIGSPHNGGANVVFADGHVEFLSSSMDQKILNALLTKAGSELVHW